MVISSFRGLPIAMDLVSVPLLQGGLSKNGAGQMVEVQLRTHCGWEVVNRRWEVVNQRWEAVNRRWEAEQAVTEVGEGNAGLDVVYGTDCWFDSTLQAASRLEWSFRMHYSGHLVRHIPPQDVTQTSAFLCEVCEVQIQRVQR